MKKFVLCLATILMFCVAVDFAQTKRIVRGTLINTSWKFYFKESSKDKWNDWAKITFLKGGKLKIDGEPCENGSWSLKGRNLDFGFVNCNALEARDISVVIRGSQANGGGLIGMSGRPNLVRLIKE